jgi:hypothetical protein
LRLAGTFRGGTLDSGGFNFLSAQDGALIEGKVADEMSAEEIDRLHEWTNQEGEVELLRTTINCAAGTTEERYVMLRARSLSDPSFEDDGED